MNVDKPFTRILLLLLFGGIALVGINSLIWHGHSEWLPVYRQETRTGTNEMHYSPSEDLEEYDLKLLDSAESSVDVAMYAFTDQKLADKLLSLAKRGVHIRLYRDRLQFRDEEARARRQGTLSTTDRLLHQAHIEVRVKSGSASMHLKSLCIDRSILRIGSANWSLSGEMNQDNDFYIIRDQASADLFETDFNTLWTSASNLSE